jgi:hypothetical protein
MSHTTYEFIRRILSVTLMILKIVLLLLKIAEILVP